MSALILIERCRAAGITLRVIGGALEYDAPDTHEADALLEEVAAHKQDVVLALSGRAVRRITQDPRPDIHTDSRWWGWTLKLAAAEYGNAPDSVLGVLHGVRGDGARLTRQAGGGLKLEPGDEYAGTWAGDRQRWLVPHRAAISDVLGRVAAMIAEDHERDARVVPA